ncbi:hypothetical protein [Streptomyces huiliensis]|uniref:hypothetical protein n=1 Tax=Streptomyces huiliensis TaxID=2876027 RepID=UPI001CBD6F56|nr:hypothetical protein [Streptomyces huiliensis]MBZ4320615.1 hypothetical protein [Streptomyces huiliensis]
MTTPAEAPPVFPLQPPTPIINPTPISPEQWQKGVEEIWANVKGALDTAFGPAKIHKAGGLQGITTSGQVIKIDPSLIKYDEKGLTVAGVQVFEHKTLSLHDKFGDQIKKFKEKYAFLDGGKAKRAREEKESTSTTEDPLEVAKDALRRAKKANDRLDAQRNTIRQPSPPRRGAGLPEPRRRGPLFSTRAARNIRELQTRVRNLEIALG